MGTGLRSVNTSYRKQRQRQLEQEHFAELRAADKARIRQRILDGTWHDPRLDCVAGNGVMCELGIGDEYFGDADSDHKEPVENEKEQHTETRGWNWIWGWGGNGNATKKPRPNPEDLRAIEAIPIVVINNFDSKGGGPRKTELLDVLAQWAATLAENGVSGSSVL